MNRYRLRFSKTGRAVYISHLDLMRTFQRAFIRAGIELRHTEGFNPHPYMSFALPLSVGMTSVCEAMDFDLKEVPPPDDLAARLNRTLPEGITVLEVYESARKFTEIAWVVVSGRLVYDGGIPDDAAGQLLSFYQSKELIVPKKSKKGMVDFNIAAGIGALRFIAQTNTELTLETRLTAQNPALNPEYLMAALRLKKPELAPNFAAFTRLELFDAALTLFR